MRNYWTDYDYVNNVYVDHREPVLMPDCVTPASGTNFTVELLTAQGQWVASRALGVGEFAGLFGWGSFLYAGNSLLEDCKMMLLRIRVWDSSTGTNYASATLRGSTSFTNRINWCCGCGVPNEPKPLKGFRSFCLGAPRATNVFSFADPPNFYGSRLSPQATVRVWRQGNLGSGAHVNWSVLEEAPPGAYVPTSGIISFAPDQAVAEFVMSIPPDTIEGRSFRVPIGLVSTNENAVVDGSTGKASLLFFDDTYIKIRWEQGYNGPGFLVTAFAPRDAWFRVAYSYSLELPQWKSDWYYQSGWDWQSEDFKHTLFFPFPPSSPFGDGPVFFRAVRLR